MIPKQIHCRWFQPTDKKSTIKLALAKSLLPLPHNSQGVPCFGTIKYAAAYLPN
jgi:hypothetical protein